MSSKRQVHDRSRRDCGRISFIQRRPQKTVRVWNAEYLTESDFSQRWQLQLPQRLSVQINGA